jgi:hypothetical protein
MINTSCGQRNQRSPLVPYKKASTPIPEGGVLEVRDKFFLWLEDLSSSPIVPPGNLETLTYEIEYKDFKRIKFFPSGSNLQCEGHFKQAFVREKFLAGDDSKGFYSFSVSKKLKDFQLEIGYGKEAREVCENFVDQFEIPSIKRDVHLERKKDHFVKSLKERLETTLIACRSNKLFNGLRCIGLEMEFNKKPYRQMSWKEDGALLSLNYILESPEGLRFLKGVKMFLSPLRFYLPEGNILAKKGFLLAVVDGQENDFISEVKDLKLLFSPN